MLTKIRQADFFHILTSYKHFEIFILGAFSGMPLAIIYSTLGGFLKDANIDIAVITSFAVSRIFYSLKFAWAPLIDHLKIPVLGKVGHRKSWMILSALIIAYALYGMSMTNPIDDIKYLYILAITLGIASSTFDIVFDAFRIERFAPEEQSLAAANTIFGYRLGMLLSGGYALMFADDYGWQMTFLCLSAIFIVGSLFILTTKEVTIEREKVTDFSYKTFDIMVLKPFQDFFSKESAWLILWAIIFFKLGDAFLGVVAIPFYKELGFTGKEIFSIIKVWGLAATIIGSYLGGYLMLKYGNFKTLIITGIAQSVTNIVFVWLNHVPTTEVLTIAIAIENIGAGMGTTALVGYLSYLCNKQYSATQYALLSSASGLASHSIVAYGGTIVKFIGWDIYFIMTVILAFPAIVMFLKLHKRHISAI